MTKNAISRRCTKQHVFFLFRFRFRFGFGGPFQGGPGEISDWEGRTPKDETWGISENAG